MRPNAHDANSRSARATPPIARFRVVSWVVSYVLKPYTQSILLLFLDTYFHEDWSIDAITWDRVIADYMVTADDGGIQALVADIDAVVEERNDPEVARLLGAHLVNVDVGAAGFPDEWGWLEVLRRRLANRGIAT